MTVSFSLLDTSSHAVDADGTERQAIKDTDSNNNPRSKIRACSICDPFVLIIREDDTIGLFIGESERGKIRRKDMSPMGEKVCSRSVHFLRWLNVCFQSSRYLAGCFFSDALGVFQTRQNSNIVITSNGPQKTSTLANVASGNQSQWLVLCRPQGVMEVRLVISIHQRNLKLNRFGRCLN